MKSQVVIAAEREPNCWPGAAAWPWTLQLLLWLLAQGRESAALTILNNMLDPNCSHQKAVQSKFISFTGKLFSIFKFLRLI